jgi:hypothetical protein
VAQGMARCPRRIRRYGDLSAGLSRSEARNFDVTLRDRCRARAGHTFPSIRASGLRRHHVSAAAQMRHSGVVTELPWPERFAVTMTPMAGPTKTFEVCAWLSRWKAISIAHEYFRHADPTLHMYDVNVEPLGFASRNDHGTVDPGNSVVDRRRRSDGSDSDIGG